MKIKLSELRPGMYVWPQRQTGPAVLELDAMAIEAVTLGVAGVEWRSRWAHTDGPRPDTQEIIVAGVPPRVLMSWDEDSQSWAILVDTTNGSEKTRLNIALNDAELFDGVTDPEERDEYGHTEADHEAAGACVREPRMVSAGSIGTVEDGTPVRSQRVAQPCPECGSTLPGYHRADCSHVPAIDPDDAAYAREVEERQARAEERET